MQELKDKIALVTGATRGLGKGIALALARQGATIIVNYPPFESEPVTVIQEIVDLGGQAKAMMADVSNYEQVQQMFQRISAEYGQLDILVNNAGTAQAKDIFEIEEEDWHRIVETNLSSGFYCSKMAMQMMREQQSGRIVFISSMVAHQGAIFGHVHYSASKSGQLGMVKTLARTAARLGITVNAVAPGIIETELLFKTHGKEEVGKLAASVPLGLGRPDDVGNAVAFLCSSQARYITGATLDVNGGMYLR
ncbi:3-oxoacyl-[acyl-carrier protein] reductase [Dyadobacter jejuensis]|uniref:3-oxoacyl-[acyl-carrier protein] reductase n=1 Tax=Dyadobacter jejuensis TaxID=1082580 RepID=A0A316A8J4_9BACT|nr:3-oxoacyl-ACP reductase family protein [Dyadobacter jejuensis]PWJ54065.1 3-oxoacyl-[acyl-carrier protein] reductase [Dyadobacter jejuensis]